MWSVHQSVWSLKYCIFELSLSRLDFFFWPIGLIQGQQSSCKSEEENKKRSSFTEAESNSTLQIYQGGAMQ